MDTLMNNTDVVNLNLLTYANPEFSSIRKLGMVYVDKTLLIAKLASQRAPIFFSRPRRFGKSLLVNTLQCLFEKGLEYFHGLDIEKLWNDKTYRVIHLDFSEIADSDAQEFKILLSKVILNEFDQELLCENKSDELSYPNLLFSKIIKKFDNDSLVLLIDEYDAPLVHHIDDKNELKGIVSVLNNFYSTVKRYTGKFRFIFITGVTRVSHVSIFSAFNNLKDLTFNEEYDSLLGFTQNDLQCYFDQFIKNASKILNIDSNDIYKRIEKYYDGFQFSFDSKETLYNPWSILSFLDNPNDGFKNYWFESGGTSSIIMQYLKISDSFNILNYRDNKFLKSKKELTAKYEIDSIPNEILLLQAGYFTLRKETSQMARLIFPNAEVEDSILDLYLSANNLKISNKVQFELDELSDHIDRRNLSSIINIFNDILNDCVSILSKIFQDERSVRDIIYAALPQELYLQKFKERETLQGFSDLELLTSKTHMIIEFKRTTLNRDAKASLDEAVKQIQSKKYGLGAFKSHQLYRVAMVISSEEKAILQDYSKEVV